MSYPLKVSLTAYQEADAANVYYGGKPMGWDKNILKSPEDTHSKLSQTPKNFGCLRDDKKNWRDKNLYNFIYNHFSKQGKHRTCIERF
jgi:hypothetical protein